MATDTRRVQITATAAMIIDLESILPECKADPCWGTKTVDIIAGKPGHRGHVLEVDRDGLKWLIDELDMRLPSGGGEGFGTPLAHVWSVTAALKKLRALQQTWGAMT